MSRISKCTPRPLRPDSESTHFHWWAARKRSPEGFAYAQRGTSGTVKFFDGAKGFGFITPKDGSKDVFVHATALEAAGILSLNEGDKVTFALEDDKRGRGKASRTTRQSVADWVSQETGAAGRCYQSIPESTLEDAREWHFAPESPSY
jgi:cold shock protein